MKRQQPENILKGPLENVLLKLITFDQNIADFLTWLNTEVKMHHRWQNAKLCYFKSKQKSLQKRILMEKMHET